ncbi:STAS domain-containing protein [Candidatus Kryptobacter tengchongensis]|uniref:Anti-sigma factor antagonist n=1 Tax=Kryptobacter tengchongensis TaxID=1643429 RepID=A0A656DDE4_KRYT1|nr:STAS domain-containing protein [Candidatus Kryptobacter tengchongensis]CUT05885.1 anti-sigma B factor antagonist [Candidatus Kryptobacter tengchongensis]
MRLRAKEFDDVVVIEVKGNLMGGPDSQKFRELLHKLLDQGKNKVVVDVKNVKFMNSAGLGTLISGLTTMRNGGGDLKIANPTDKIESLLMITRLIKVFETYNSVEEAIESYKKRATKKK